MWLADLWGGAVCGSSLGALCDDSQSRLYKGTAFLSGLFGGGKLRSLGLAARNAVRRGGAANTAKGGAGPVRLGQAGEGAAAITKNTERIPSALSSGRYRVPDVSNRSARILGEVKNVDYLPYTRQLRDYAAIAQREGFAFDLYVRRSTTLSEPLQQGVRSGAIQLRSLP